MACGAGSALRLTLLQRAGGKRLRPIITILAGKALGYDHEKLYSLAAMV